MAFSGRGEREPSKFTTFQYYDNLAKQHGVPEPEVKKPSLFRRTIDILQRPNYAVAGFAGAFTERGKAAGENPLQEAWDGFTGREKETFSDVLGDVGVENKYAKGIAGFALDVVLDPTTWFGGAFVKAGAKVAKVGLKAGAATGKAVGLGRQIRAIETTASDIGTALKRGFQRGFGTSTKLTKLKGVSDDALGNYKVTEKGVFERSINEAGEEVFEKKVGIVENGVIKDLKGKKEIGSFESVVGGIQKYFSKAIGKPEDYDEILGETGDLFKGYDQKTLDSAFDIMAYNTKLESGVLKGAGKIDDIVYRGQPKDFKFRRAVSDVSSEDNILIGKGVFTTTNKDIAKTYGENISAFKKPTKRILDISNANEKDLRKIMPDSFFEERRLGGLIHRPDDTFTSTYKTYKEAVKNGDIKDAEDILMNNIIEKFTGGKGVEELVSGGSSEIGKLKSARDAAAKFLQKKGYNVIKHQGGIRAGGKKLHDVYIALSDEALQPISKTAKQLYKSGEGEVAAVVKLMKELGQKTGKQLAEAKGIKGKEWYIPLVDKNKLKQIKKYNDRYEILGDNLAKELKGVVPEKDLLRDPVELYSRARFELTHDVLRQETMANMIEAFGKKAGAFTSEAEARAAGFKPIFRNGSEELVGMTGDKKASKLLGYLQNTDAKFVDNSLFPEFKTVDMLAKASGYDKFTSVFKELVTAWFPAFHVRNMFSGYVQNYSVLGARAFDPTTIPQGITVMSKKLTEKAGLDGVAGHTFGEIRDALIDKFGYSSRYVVDIDNITSTIEAGTKFKKLAKLHPRRAGNWIEMNQKANATIGALKQGKSLDEALNLAEKAGFDYSKITQFESKIMKRAIPFYTFARKNAALQASTFTKHPERILNQVKFTNMLSNVFGGGKPTEEDLDGVPPWALNAMGFKVQDGKYISKFGLPMEEFVERIANPVKTTLTSLNPLMKYPLEAKTGFDFFRERQIKDITSVKSLTAEILTHEKTPKWLKDAFHVTSYVGKDGKKRYNADPENLHKLRNLPTSRFQSTADKMFEDGITNVTPAKIVSFLIGAQLYDIDQELQANFAEKDLIKAYQEELQSRGIIYDYSMFPESKTTNFEYKE